ncbi:MAG: vitamin B12 dependent-methionine synthase activation domain-containing protein, partial [Bdellovibrionota bacterium]
GSKIVEESLENIFYFLDEFALLRSRFGFTQSSNQSNEEFDEVIKNKAYPIYQSLKEKLIRENTLQARAVYGYFPACSHGDKIFVYDPKVTADVPMEERKILTTFEVPRQTGGRRLCVADFIKNVHSGEIDTLAMQVVSLGV